MRRVTDHKLRSLVIIGGSIILIIWLFSSSGSEAPPKGSTAKIGSLKKKVPPKIEVEPHDDADHSLVQVEEDLRIAKSSTSLFLSVELLQLNHTIDLYLTLPEPNRTKERPKEKLKEKTSSVKLTCPQNTSQVIPGSLGVMIPVTSYDILINPVDKAFYEFCRFAGMAEADYLVDWLGVKTFYEYDCSVTNCPPGWGGRDCKLPYGDYYKWVPSRRVPCDQYLLKKKLSDPADFKSRFEIGYLPVVDDEYPRYINVLESVLRTKSDFVVVEVGARYGTWGARALAAWKQKNPTKPAKFVGIEEDGANLEMMRTHLRVNGMLDQSTLILKHAGPKSESSSYISLKEIMVEGKIDHIDLLDIDVHLHELGFLLDDSSARELLESKVVAVHANTHSGEIHRKLVDTFESWNWIKRFDYYGNYYICDGRVNDAMQFDKICNTETPWGYVYIRDGLFTFLNPKFVSKP